MTQEEYNAEMAERQRLLNEIASLENRIRNAQIRQAELQGELDLLVENMDILANNVSVVGDASAKRVNHGKQHIGFAEKDVSDLYYVIDQLVTSYFQFKEMSTASKNISEATDEYHTKYREYNRLRRITLGYVIGLDQNFASKETMRKQVEKIYLQNTEYWLAYASAAVMLWASNEQEAAKRAVARAVYMNYNAAYVFFLLINLRFTRVETAKKWYLGYLDHVDSDHLGEEWECLLEAFLSGVFGVDPAFNELVQNCFKDMFSQLETTHPMFKEVIANDAAAYADNFLHITGWDFMHLRRYCPVYDDMKHLLSTAEKNAVLTEQFRGFWTSGGGEEMNIYERVEEILYDLINTPDSQEQEVLKKMRLNKYILQAKGDVTAAQNAYKQDYAEKETTTFADLLFRWGFAGESERVDIRVRQFSLRFLKKYLADGFNKFALEYRKKEMQTVPIQIDGWEEECDENSYDSAARSLYKYYNKNRLKDLFADKYVVIFVVMLAASIAALGICAFQFNKIVLTAGILLGVAGGFLLWRRVVDLSAQLSMKQNKSLTILQNCIGEIGQWRQLYKAADAQNAELVNLFENIDRL